MTLISPIKIDGQFYCANEGYAAALDGEWRTESVLAGTAALDTTELDNAWYITPRTNGGTDPNVFPQNGSIKFGLACGVQSVGIRLSFDVDETPSPSTIYVKLNGVGSTPVVSQNASPPGTTDVTIIILEPSRPCGNIIEISGTMNSSNNPPPAVTDVYLRAEILSVS